MSRKPFKRKSSAIAGAWIERVGKRVVLWRGGVGAWTLHTGRASASQIEYWGFNLDAPDVREVMGLSREGSR